MAPADPARPAPTAVTVAAGSGPAAAAAASDGAAQQQPLPVASAETITAQQQSVAVALRDKNHPERLSTLVMPAPFDRAAYARNPQAYLGVVEPGRAFQSAQPGPGVQRLHALGPVMRAVPQDQHVALAVRTEPYAPTTFTSLDLGRFNNQLTSITVPADANGIAVAPFTPGPGTVAQVRVLVASPVASGQETFVITVEAPAGHPAPIATGVQPVAIPVTPKPPASEARP